MSSSMAVVIDAYDPLPLEEQQLALPVTSVSASLSSSSALQRTDGRAWNEIRPISFRLGVLSHCNGSCYYEQGNTKVIVAVYGPRQKRKHAFSPEGRLFVEFKYSPICVLTWNAQKFSSSSISSSSSSSASSSLSVALRNLERASSKFIVDALSPSVLLHLYAKSSIDLHIYVVEDDGAAVAAAVCAASLALAHAGIQCYDLVSAVKCVRNSSSPLSSTTTSSVSASTSATSLSLSSSPSTFDFVLDPCSSEEFVFSSDCTLCFLCSLHHLTHFSLRGSISPTVLSNFLSADWLRESVGKIAERMRKGTEEEMIKRWKEGDSGKDKRIQEEINRALMSIDE